MATRVDFYLLSSDTPEGKLRFACRLARKLYTMGNSAYIHALDADQAKRLDDLMWTFEQSSFIPHRLQDEGDVDAEATPVIIGHQAPAGTNVPDVLISLLHAVPQCAQRFARVAELVDNDPGDKQCARERFRLYRQRGCQVETHQINA